MARKEKRKIVIEEFIGSCPLGGFMRSGLMQFTSEEVRRTIALWEKATPS